VYILLPFAEDASMRRLYLLITLLLFAGSAFSQRVTELYQASEEFDFAVERDGIVIGSQHAVCNGWRINGIDSTLVFNMETKTAYTRSGKSIDLDVACEVGYLPTGLPKIYQYTLNFLGTEVKHTGEFADSFYSGSTVRLGVTQPVRYRTRRHAILFDNNFAMQWEIAVRPVVRLGIGDSVVAETVVPQLNQVIKFTVHSMPDEMIDYGGKQISARVFRVDPANQLLYLDGDGRLLKAYDPAQKIAIRRLAVGEKAEIASESWFSIFRKRLPIYGLLAAFAAIWLLSIAYRDIKRPDIAVMIVSGAVLYWLSVQLLTPLQNAYFQSVLDPKSVASNFYLVVLGSALLFALVEESTKFVCVFLRSLLKAGHNLKFGMALGAACGAGFALMQAANLLAFTPTGGAAVPADLAQRFFSIGLNTATGAMIGMLIMARCSWAYYLIPIGLKTLLNWLAYFMQKGAMRPATYSFLTFVFAALTLIVLYLLYRRLQATKTTGSTGKSRQVF
jgi:RsiW-degrading membrane proteinase PrsW (M82 family)